MPLIEHGCLLQITMQGEVLAYGLSLRAGESSGFDLSRQTLTHYCSASRRNQSRTVLATDSTNARVTCVILSALSFSIYTLVKFCNT